MKKKILALALAFVMLFAVLPTSGFAIADGNVAKIGDTEYETLEAAFAAAQDGDTITVLADCAGNGIIAEQGKFTTGLTVDFKGFTYTVDGTTVGSTGTETNGFQLLKGNNITFTNGTITSTKAKILIQNYSNLTLDKMELDGSSLTDRVAYTLSTNNGSTTINDSKIIAKENGFAFDACSGWGGYQSNAVTVSGSSVITGNVEVSYLGQTGTAPATLTLTSGTLSGNIVMAQGADQATVTKANDFVAEAPADYKWNDAGKLVSKYVAQIGETKYETLADAIAAVPTNGTETTITMLADETIDVATSPLTVAAGKKVILDLNGQTITGSCGSGTTSALITNKGSLTINDNIGVGKLIGGADPTWTWDGTDDYSGSYASNLIRNEGTLVVNGGTLYNTSTGSAAYAIDNYSAGKVTVNGGTIDAKKSSAIRLFYNNGGSIDVTGGRIGHYNTDDDCSYMGIQVQSGDNADVTISGGTVDGSYSVYSKCTGDSSVTIRDGSFPGVVGFGSTGPNTISINGGKFESKVVAWGDQTGFISGGTFTEDPTEYVAAGYYAKDNGDGTYTVSKIEYTYTENEQTAGEVTIAVADESRAVVTVQKGEGVTVESTAVVAALNDAEPFTDDATVRVYVDSTPAGTGENSITYSVAAMAEITVGNEAATTLTLGNDQLGENPSFTFPLDVTDLGVAVGGLVKATHQSEGHADEVKTYVVKAGANDTKYIEVTTSYFSTWTLEGIDTTGKVAAEFHDGTYVTSYETLQAAVNGVTAGNTLVLLENIEIASMTTLNKSFTLDLNGKTIGSVNDTKSVFQVINDATLTINGTTAGSTLYGRINVGKAGNDNGNVVLNGGTYAVGQNQTVLHVNGECRDSDVTITGATITSENDNGVQFNGAGTFTITNSTITGKTAVYQKAGELTISSSTLTSNAAAHTGYKFNGNGSNPTGDAIVVDTCAYPGGAPKLTLGAGNTITVEENSGNLQIGYYEYGTDPDPAMITATSNEIDVDDNFKWVEKENTGVYELVAKNYVAQIGNAKYETLAEAIAAVPKDGTEATTITMLADSTEGTISVNGGRNIVLDLGKHTVTPTFLYVLNGKLTAKNGTIANTVYVYPLETKNSGMVSEFTLASNAAIKAKDGYSVVLNNLNGSDKGYDGTINIAGKLNGNIWVLGNIKEGDSVINFSGTIESEGSGVGIALNGNATVNVTGGKIEASNSVADFTGIEVRAGNLNVSGGTITGKGTYSIKSNGSGTTTTGAGIAVAQHTTKLPVAVTLSGGTINGTKPISVADPEGNGYIASTDTAHAVNVVATQSYTENAVIPEGYKWVASDSNYTLAPIEYVTVTFNSVGGSEVASQTVEAGQPATKPTAPTKDGYTFQGWLNGEDAFDFATAINADITLTASWTKESYDSEAYIATIDDTNFVYREYLNLQDQIYYTVQLHVEKELGSNWYVKVTFGSGETDKLTGSEFNAFNELRMKQTLASGVAYACTANLADYYEVRHSVYPTQMGEIMKVELYDSGDNRVDLYSLDSTTPVSGNTFSFHKMNANGSYTGTTYDYLDRLKTREKWTNTAMALIAYGHACDKQAW